MTLPPLTIDIDEALRYMGCPPERAPRATRELAEDGAREILDAAQPRWCWRLCSLSRDKGTVMLDGALPLPGRDIARHLAGCGRAAVFAATLSARVDGCIRRSQSRDMARALALDCCASAAVESLCDAVERQLQEQFPGCYFPYRYSPGYGDLPLEVQNDLLALLDAPRRIGLTASQSHILIPRKSVTAILGIAEQPVAQTVRSCRACPAREKCEYRKAGGHCGVS